MEPLRGEADLHRGQHQDHEDGGSGNPGHIIAEEAAIVVPAAEVGVEGRETGEAMDDVDAGEAELSAQKAWVDHIWVTLVYLEELPGQALLVCSYDWRTVFIAR